MKIGEYLLKRLRDYGVTEIFGVPGDYNLGLLDVVTAYPHITWVGNCNELNAAYAADGYAREKGMGALITTMGVGELSALNGIAGSYAEDVPVVQITGISSIPKMIGKVAQHHTLGDGDYNHFKKVYEELTVYATVLTSTNAKKEIDKALKMAKLYKKPVYIGIPEDIVTRELEEFDENISEEKYNTSKKNLDKFINDFKDILERTNEQIFVFDHFIERYSLQKEVETLIEKAKIPFATLTLGRAVISDNNKYALGVYRADTDTCKNCDLSILIGTKPNEWFKALSKDIVKVKPFYCQINDTIYSEIYMEDAINAIIDADLKFSTSMKFEDKVCQRDNYQLEDRPITCDLLTKVVQKHIKPGMTLIAEQGTAFFSGAQLHFHDDVKFFSQSLWASIGYTLGATLGAGVANRDRRCMLLIGDGSFQLTAQEMSTIIREGINPIIILNNNGGYTIERYIAGAHKKYNDVQDWDYDKFVEALTAEDCRIPVLMRAKTTYELDKALEEAEKAKDKMVFIEIFTDKFDAPEELRLFSKVNAPKDRYNEGVKNQDLPEGIL